MPNPHALGRCVTLLHGYADAKVGAIAWAPLWYSLGYHILAFDLRAHGESEGAYSTAGYFERHDLNQLLNQLRAERPSETRQSRYALAFNEVPPCAAVSPCSNYSLWWR